jgi:hypothetical protein
MGLALMLLTLCSWPQHSEADSVAWLDDRHSTVLLPQNTLDSWTLYTASTLLMPCQLPPPAKVRDSQMF